MDFNLAWEWFGVLAAVVYVFLASKGSRWCFVFGLISSVIFIQICFSERLYFDTSINVYYVIMSIVGWINWKSEDGKIIPVKMSNRKFRLLLIGSFAISIILGYFTDQYSDASLPFLDSFTTILAVVGTWMIVQKIIQNWIIWIIADSVSIFMYIYKDHFPMALLFLVYTIISFYGFFNWRKKMIST